MEAKAERAAILDCMAAFIAQRSGIEARDYFENYRDREGVAAFNSDRREVARDGKEARTLLAAIRWREGIDADCLKGALQSAFGGRLSWDGEALEYTAGQNGSTEYRAAACAVLALALRRYWRAQDMNATETAKREFGRGLSSRWFN